MSTSSVCLLRLSAIGDVSHAVAMVSRIRRQRPDIALTWIIGKVEHQLVKHIPGVEFIVFDKSRGKQAYADLKQEMAGRAFDTLLLMQVAFRANLVSRLIKARRKIGFDWHRSKELHWLFTHARIRSQQHAHVLDGFMAFADRVGIPEQAEIHWDLPIPEGALNTAETLVGDLGGFAIISPAASNDERNWLPERYGAVADYLSKNGLKTVVCGGPGPLDRALADAVLQHTSSIALDLVGKTSLVELLAVIARAKLVVAPDTGPAHMATMVGTPVIGLYAHSNPRRTGPYNDLHRVVSVYDQVIEEQQGKPWQQLPWGTRAKGNDLMARIQVESVTEQIARLLSP